MYSPHPKAEEEEKLIDESESQGKAFSAHMRSVYGNECCQFIDASLTDTVVILITLLVVDYCCCT